MKILIINLFSLSISFIFGANHSSLLLKDLSTNCPKELQKHLLTEEEHLLTQAFAELEEMDLMPTFCFAELEDKNLYVYSCYKKRMDLYAMGLLYLTVIEDLSKDKSNYYRNLTYCQKNRALDMAYTWSVFGNQIINFSSNSLPTYLKDASIEKLEQIYGKEALCFWMNLSTPYMHVDKTEVINLAKRDMTSGRCLGMSLEFARFYLEDTESHPNESCFGLIKNISRRFIKGASHAAELAQIAHLASVRHVNIEARKNTWYIEKTIPFEDNSDLIAKGFDLTLGPCISFCNPSQEEFNHFPSGCYLVALGLGNLPGHIILLIKTEENVHYLFDSNFGTLYSSENEFLSLCKKLINEYNKTDHLEHIILRRVLLKKSE
jgi:hypothetical protein